MTNVSRRELSVLALRSPRVAARLVAKFSTLFFSRFGDGEEAETRAFAFVEKEGLDLVLDVSAFFDEALDSFGLPSCPSSPGVFLFAREEFFSGIGSSLRETATFLGFDRARVLREIGEGTLDEALLDEALSAKAERDAAREARERSLAEAERLVAERTERERTFVSVVGGIPGASRLSASSLGKAGLSEAEPAFDFPTPRGPFEGVVAFLADGSFRVETSEGFAVSVRTLAEAVVEVRREIGSAGTVAARLARADEKAEIESRARLAEIERELAGGARAGVGFFSKSLLAERAKIVSELRLFALRK